MAVRSLSPSSFAFNDSNYDNENANAGSRSHLCLKSTEDATKRLHERMKGTMVDYEVHTVSETQYVDVFFYEEGKVTDETR